MMKRFIGSNSLLLNYAKKSNKIRNIKKILLDTPPESPKSYLNWLSQLKKQNFSSFFWNKDQTVNTQFKGNISFSFVSKKQISLKPSEYTQYIFAEAQMSFIENQTLP